MTSFPRAVESQLIKRLGRRSAFGTRGSVAIQLIARVHCAQREDESYVPHFPAMLMMFSDR